MKIKTISQLLDYAETEEKARELINYINKQKEVLDKIKEELKPYKYDYNTILLVSFDQMKDTIKAIQRIVDEVEITEEHKIPDKIDQWDKKWNYVYYKKEILNQMKDNIEQLRQKYNEIIDYLEE